MKATSPTCSAVVPLTSSPSAASAIAPPATRRYDSVGAASGVLGVVFLMLGTALHPVPADGNDAAVAFGVYAEVSRSVWLAAHLLPLVGITGMVLAMVLLSRAVATTGTGRLWARLTEATGAAAIAVTAVLQAVDGVALKAIVDMWAHASAADGSALFAAAQAVRQVEIGMDAVFSLGLAMTTLAFAVVLWEARRAGRVLAGVSLATAATAAVAGVLFGLQGFSAADMNAGMASGLLGMVLTVAAAAWVRRRTAGRGARDDDHRPSHLPEVVSDRHGASSTRVDAAMTDLLGRHGSAAGVSATVTNFHTDSRACSSACPRCAAGCYAAGIKRASDGWWGERSHQFMIQTMRSSRLEGRRPPGFRPRDESWDTCRRVHPRQPQSPAPDYHSDKALRAIAAN